MEIRPRESSIEIPAAGASRRSRFSISRRRRWVRMGRVGRVRVLSHRWTMVFMGICLSGSGLVNGPQVLLDEDEPVIQRNVVGEAQFFQAVDQEEVWVPFAEHQVELQVEAAEEGVNAPAAEELVQACAAAEIVIARVAVEHVVVLLAI